MKKSLSYSLILAMLFVISSCGSEEVAEDVYESVETTEADTEEASSESQSEESDSQVAVQTDKVTFILDWLPNTNHTGIYAAIENGYFADENIEVEVIQPGEDDVSALVGNGQGEFGVSFQETLTMARTAENPIPIVAVAAILQHNTSGFSGLAEKGIDSAKDFEGKIYGSWGTEIETAFIRSMMEKEGADPSLLDVIDIQSYDFLTSITNDVDFQWIYYGWDGVAAQVKGVDVSFVKLQDVDPVLDFYTPIIITSESLISENPDLVRRFLAAASKGYDYTVENPSEAADILLKYAPETDSDIAHASQEYLAGEFISDASQWGIMSEDIWTNFSQWMYDNGIIASELDIEKAYTNEFLPGQE